MVKDGINFLFGEPSYVLFALFGGKMQVNIYLMFDEMLVGKRLVSGVVHAPLSSVYGDIGIYFELVATERYPGRKSYLSGCSQHAKVAGHIIICSCYSS